MANNNWNNYTEKTATPVDADEVMVRDSADGKNKKLLFGTFWKWVAKKLNEATISELQTSNKTIVGALNQLNSDSFKKISNEYRMSNGITENAGKYPISSEKYAVIAAYNSYTSHIIVPFIASSDKTWRCYVTKTDFTPINNTDSYVIIFLVAPIK